jgi:hypothetical protein
MLVMTVPGHSGAVSKLEWLKLRDSKMSEVDTSTQAQTMNWSQTPGAVMADLDKVAMPAAAELESMYE